MSINLVLFGTGHRKPDYDNWESWLPRNPYENNFSPKKKTEPEDYLHAKRTMQRIEAFSCKGKMYSITP